MARQITVAFAINGDRVEVPVGPLVDGQVSFETGYTFDYSRLIGSDPLAKNIERTKLNAMFFDFSEILQQFQQDGAPEWYADTEYAQFSRVKHEGTYYVAAVVTEQEPGSGSDWEPVNMPAASRLNNLDAITDPTVNDDSTDGYSALSQWINTATNEIWLCISSAPGAAVWVLGSLTVDELGNVALLNANAVGQNLLQLANPSAIRYLQVNADNSVTALSAEGLRTALSLGDAALATVVSSLEDATADRLQKVGSFGSGLVGPSNLISATFTASRTALGMLPNGQWRTDAAGRAAINALITVGPEITENYSVIKHGIATGLYVLDWTAQSTGAKGFLLGTAAGANLMNVVSWNTRNTSTDVQALLAAANNAAIRTAIGLAAMSVTTSPLTLVQRETTTGNIYANYFRTTGAVSSGGVVGHVAIATEANPEILLRRTLIDFKQDMGVAEYQEADVVLGGDFGVQTVRCVRIGNLITISALTLLTHASATEAASDVGVIPAAFRTGGIVRDNCTSMITSVLDVLQIDTFGTLRVRHYDTAIGNPIARTTMHSGATITYTTL